MPNVIEYLKQAKDIADTMDNVALKAIIVDLHSEILNLQQENLLLKEDLNQKNSFDMIFQNNMYYNHINATTMAGPYCSACWDSNKQAIRMHMEDSNYFCCPICKKGVCV